MFQITECGLHVRQWMDILLAVNVILFLFEYFAASVVHLDQISYHYMWTENNEICSEMCC